MRLVDHSWLPLPLVRLLEEQHSVPWTCRVAVRGSDTLSVIVAQRTFERVFANPKRTTGVSTRRCLWPDQDIAAAIERAHAVLLPTLTIDGRKHVAFLWALAEPLQLATDSGRALARDLLRRAATAVGAETPDEQLDLFDLSVPLPGTRIVGEHMSDETPVSVVDMDLSRVYTLETFTAAIAATRERHA